MSAHMLYMGSAFKVKAVVELCTAIIALLWGAC